MEAKAAQRQPLHILCADDNAELVDLIAETLRFYGYEVESAVDGGQALDRIAAQPGRFDLLITDLQMPILNGAELVVEARAAGFHGKVIVFSAALSLEERQRFGELGVEAIIDKPGAHRELIGVVARLQADLWEQTNADAA